MSRPSKPFSEYPAWVMDVVQKMQQEPLVQLPGGNLNSAISAIHTFNRGRAQLVRETKLTNPNLAEIALDIVARRTNLAGPGQQGEFLLEFTRRGLAILADENRPSKRGMPSPLRDVKANGVLADIDKALGKETLDDHDEELKKLFNINLGKDKAP